MASAFSKLSVKSSMDREHEEMRFMGLFGIYKETFKLIFSLRQIFAQITLTLILPLSVIFLAQKEVSGLLYHKILFNQFLLEESPAGTREYHRISDLVNREWAKYILLEIFYFIFALGFSLLSTSAVVYATACKYTFREITFRRIMSVVPKVWKRLVVTFVCTAVAFLGYNAIFGIGFYLWGVYAEASDSSVVVVVFVGMVVLYAVGLVYMTIVWQLASVVSVLEDLRGFRAMAKGRRLAAGRVLAAGVVFLLLGVTLVGSNVGFEVSLAWRALPRAGLVALCVAVLTAAILIGLVVQTVIYFVCKAHHHERIDRSALADHLEVIYLGEYVPLKGAAPAPAAPKDVQLEEYRV